MLELSKESSNFIEGCNAVNLSNYLLWYAYHDVVPSSSGTRHWYHELHRGEMIGWIRFGQELGHGIGVRGANCFPKQFQKVIDDMGLDVREVCRRLIRVSDSRAMRRHELAEFDFSHDSHFLAAADKLETDRRLVEKLRPTSGTGQADWQEQILQWIETFLELTVRPHVDPTRSYRLEVEMFAGTDRARIVEADDARRGFRRICAYHVEEPLELIYVQALGIPNQRRVSAMFRSSRVDMSVHEHTWMHGMRSSVYKDERPMMSSLNLHRISAPQVAESEQRLHEIDDELIDAHKWVKELMRRRARVRDGRPDPGDNGRTSRASMLMDGRASRTSTHAGPSSGRLPSRVSHFSEDTESVYSHHEQDAIEEVDESELSSRRSSSNYFAIGSPLQPANAVNETYHAYATGERSSTLAEGHAPKLASHALRDTFAMASRQSAPTLERQSVRNSVMSYVSQSMSGNYAGLHNGSSSRVGPLPNSHDDTEQRLDSGYGPGEQHTHAATQTIPEGHGIPESRTVKKNVKFSALRNLITLRSPKRAPASLAKKAMPTVPENLDQKEVEEVLPKIEDREPEGDDEERFGVEEEEEQEQEQVDAHPKTPAGGDEGYCDDNGSLTSAAALAELALSDGALSDGGSPKRSNSI